MADQYDARIGRRNETLGMVGTGLGAVLGGYVVGPAVGLAAGLATTKKGRGVLKLTKRAVGSLLRREKFPARDMRQRIGSKGFSLRDYQWEPTKNPREHLAQTWHRAIRDTELGGRKAKKWRTMLTGAGAGAATGIMSGLLGGIHAGGRLLGGPRDKVIVERKKES